MRRYIRLNVTKNATLETESSISDHKSVILLVRNEIMIEGMWEKQTDISMNFFFFLYSETKMDWYKKRNT